jgi:phosphate-selective porin OprO and OprP
MEVGGRNSRRAPHLLLQASGCDVNQRSGRRLTAVAVVAIGCHLSMLLALVSAEPASRPIAPQEEIAPPQLPDSPAERFAQLVDSDPLTSEQPRERLAYWQSDTNEGDAIKDLRSRLEKVEDEQKKVKEGSKSKKSDKLEHNLFGRIQADGATFSQDAANRAQLGDIPNGVDFRRVRLGMQGTGHEVLFYRMEVDFVQPDEVTKKRPRLTDAYFEVRQLPWLGTFRLGQFREPYSVERYTSANDLTFMERGLPQAFHTSRNFGAMFYDNSQDQKWVWWNGLFAQRATNFGEFFSNAPRVAYVNRVDWVPWYDEASGGRYLASVGTGYSFRNLAGMTQSFSSTPEVNLQYDATSVIPSFVSTGTMTVNTMQIFQAQAFTVLGPLSFQAEYYGTYVNQLNNPNVFFQGMYVYGSYFLTGEHRPYDRKQGVFTAVKPFADFFRVRTDRGICTGLGAWEVAARFSSLNLSDRNIQGGRLNDVTLGLNWYLNYQTRFMVNYIHAFLNRHNVPSDADVVSTRAQVVW